MRYLITGATGFVGGHLAEACVQRGIAVSTIARPASDTGLLEKLGAQIHRGDLSDTDIVRKAVADADVVVHCAAKVGDWGPVEDYRVVNVYALRELLDACVDRKLQRFVHLSSLGVYPARHHYGTTEEEPLPESHMDGYTQTKIEAEQLVMDFYRDHKLPVVVLRPGFIYGPRDRTLMPRIIDNLRRRHVRYLGLSGRKKALNTIYIGNLIDAIFLAVEQSNVIGQIYNLTDGEYVSKKRFFEAIASGMNLSRPRPFAPPLWLAKVVAKVMEDKARKSGASQPPPLTQAGVKFLGLNLDFSIDKAKRELGYRPRVAFDQGIEETIAWYKQQP